MFRHSSAAGLLAADVELELQLVAQLRAVGQAGERVHQRQLLHARLRVVLQRDVGDDAAPALVDAGLVHQRTRGDRPATLRRRRRPPGCRAGGTPGRVPKAWRSCATAALASASCACCSNQPISERRPAASPSRRISAVSLGVMRTRRPAASVSHMTSADCDSKSFSSSATSWPCRSASRSARSAPAERRAPRMMAATGHDRVAGHQRRQQHRHRIVDLRDGRAGRHADDDGEHDGRRRQRRQHEAAAGDHAQHDAGDQDLRRRRAVREDVPRQQRPQRGQQARLHRALADDLRAHARRRLAPVAQPAGQAQRAQRADRAAPASSAARRAATPSAASAPAATALTMLTAISQGDTKVTHCTSRARISADSVSRPR